MVRLEAKMAKKYNVVTPKFQLQNGTIRREILDALYESLGMFQFQNGTIRSGIEAIDSILLFFVSIPKWYD